MCYATVGEFYARAPSESEPVKQAARELNPHFFRTRAAVAAAQASIVRRILSPVTSSEAPSHS